MPAGAGARGVVTVVTGKDAPNKYGILPVGHDETALAVEKVRYVGDNVACVVAESESIAEQALELIKVEYEPLPAWFDPEESMKAESDLIHREAAEQYREGISPCLRRSRAGIRRCRLRSRRPLHRQRSDACGDGAAFHAGQLRVRSANRASGTADGVVIDAGALLPAAQTLDRAGHADGADSRDQATGGRWLWRQERDHSAGDHRCSGGAQGARLR